jgi:hypothetical protein
VDNVRVTMRGGIGAGHYRPVLVWLAVALFLIVAGCSGAPAAAGDAEDASPVMAHDPHPTSYPESAPASDEVVLKWNGTLILPGEAKAVR